MQVPTQPEYQPQSELISRKPLNPKEATEGELLNSFQSASISNLRADIAEEILRLTYTPRDPEDYGVKLAYLQGQLDILSFLLTRATDTSNEMFNLTQTQEE